MIDYSIITRITCRTCGETKGVCEFHFINKQTGRRDTECKICARLRARRNQKKRHIKSGGLSYIFEGMMSRCVRKKSRDYKKYGAKGIAMHEAWIDNSKRFYKWARENGYKDDCGLWLRRINKKGDYTPWNCKFESSIRMRCMLAAKKLSPEDANKIKVAGASGESATDIARRFAVSRSNISQILRGFSWELSESLVDYDQ